MLLLQKFKVSGHSMLPILKPGQEILVSKLPYLFTKPKSGHIIAFLDGAKFIVKRVKGVKSDQVLVGGENVADSKDFGWIEKKRILGKVIHP